MYVVLKVRIEVCALSCAGLFPVVPTLSSACVNCLAICIDNPKRSASLSLQSNTRLANFNNSRSKKFYSLPLTHVLTDLFLENKLSINMDGWIRLIIGFQPLMVISPTASCSSLCTGPVLY